MEPGFQRGDVLLLWNRPHRITVGDIALVAFPTRKLPMVRRVKWILPHLLLNETDRFRNDRYTAYYNHITCRQPMTVSLKTQGM